MPLEAFAVRLRDLEAISGMSFFDRAGHVRAGEEERVMCRAKEYQKEAIDIELVDADQRPLSLPHSATGTGGCDRGGISHLCADGKTCVLPPVSRDRHKKSTGTAL
eukprot:gnl/TRDRNA2_/TRDRNA2_152575_c0_seq1.p1 gnl/TRDRNA2_/TRDRNA2_152575_c0~~gnl/TRDRNA2_/TRDRNA2_152575_c0_seq1.p1  ORF type:complete len:106 (+),score=21.35 gnl/TRDRNA2_/TRDRNA2_152575_c0_seq1:60-377(+)